MLEPLVLVVAAFAAAAISGAAGFGGGLLLLPILVATVGIPHAVPLLTIAQLVGNGSRAGFGFTQIHWKPVGLFLLGAVPLSMVGAVAFVQVPKGMVTRTIGAAILVFVALRYSHVLRIQAGPILLVVGGGVVGLVSGLVGSAGPLGAAVFLSLGLPPVAYVASEASTALAIHAVKIAIYQHFLALDREFWLLAVWMGIAMILGTWSAKRVIERLPPKGFQRLVTIFLVTIAGFMVVRG